MFDTADSNDRVNSDYEIVKFSNRVVSRSFVVMNTNFIICSYKFVLLGRGIIVGIKNKIIRVKSG